MNASINESELQLFINKQSFKKHNNTIDINKKSFYSLEVSISTPEKKEKRTGSKKKVIKKSKKVCKQPVYEEQQLPNLSLDEIEESAYLLSGDLFKESPIEDLNEWDIEEYFTNNSGDQFSYEQLPPLSEDGDWEPYYLDIEQHKEDIDSFYAEEEMDKNSGDQFKFSQIDMLEEFEPNIEVVFWDSDDE